MIRILPLFIFLLFTSFFISAQQTYTPSPDNLKSREEFQDSKFGVFIHWGIYSMLADGEWNMEFKKINHKEYRRLASGFYPSKFNAAEWVAAIKASGAKYICITSRHHDGFSMFKTAASNYNVVDATPFKRDVLKELADECARQGMRLHFYYSHLDWDREDYPRGRTGLNNGRTGKEQNWDTYFKFMNTQLTELLTNYGEVGAIWFDGKWDHDIHPDFNWQLDQQYALIHSFQSSCLIGNNHHEYPFAGEDFQMFERDLPGQNKAGFSGQEIGKLPLETCETMNKTWGYTITDTNYKSTKELIHLLVSAAGNNANLLLNIGPRPNGELPEEGVGRLNEIGKWLDVYGETIYGTRGGIVPQRDWGVTTQKGNKLYVHVLNYKDNALFLPITAKKVVKAINFKTKAPLVFQQVKNGVVINLGEVPQDIDYVAELTLKD